MIVTDLSMTKSAHVFFNSAFLKILLSVTDEPINIYAEKEHINHLTKKINSERIFWHELKITSRLGISILLQDLHSCLLILKILFKGKREESLIVLNRLPLTLLLCNIFNYFYHKPIINVLHGELEYLVNPLANGGTKLYYQIFRLAYKCSTRYNAYIFLGDSIKKTTQDRGISFNNAQLITIDHPYDYDFISNDKSQNHSNGKINIGMIGTAMLRKNSHYIYELSRLTDNSNVKFLNIGRTEKEVLKYFEKSKVDFSKESIENFEFEKLISELDYSLCFYDKTINLALASGSFFDSIKFEKPILGLKGNPYVEYYFEKLGEIGYLFNSISEMAAFVNKLSLELPKSYEIQVSNLKKAQKILSLENISMNFLKQCKEYNIF